MKKIILGSGLLLVFCSAVTLGLASRYQYHLYLYGKNLNNNVAQSTKERASTGRVAPFRYTLVNKGFKTFCSKGKHCYKVYTHNLDPQTAKEAYKPNNGFVQLDKNPRDLITEYKKNHPKQYPRYANTIQSRINYVHRNNYSRVKTPINVPKIQRYPRVSLGEKQYSLNTKGFRKGAKGIYRSKSTSLAFRVVEPHKKYTCIKNNFIACVSRLNTDFLKNQDIYDIKFKTYNFSSQQTVKNDFGNYPVAVHSFRSKSNTYYIFTIYNPIKKSIVRIESVVYNKEEIVAAEIMHDIFKSFQLLN